MRVLTRMVRGGGAQEEDAEDERAIERSYTLLPAALPSPFSHSVNNEALCAIDSNQDRNKKKHITNTQMLIPQRSVRLPTGSWACGLPDFQIVNGCGRQPRLSRIFLLETCVFSLSLKKDQSSAALCCVDPCETCRRRPWEKNAG